MIPENKTPQNTAKSVLEREKFNNLATNVPVQAPVVGKGIATNTISPKYPQRETFLDFFLILANHQFKTLPIILNFINFLKRKSKRKNKGTTGSIFPKTERI